ncbi:8-oxoguanine DNA glycosylase OGG fold protein [Streptomyces sp. NPDC004561]
MTPWPSALAPHSFTGDARVSRAQVTSMVANTLARETLREALVATYVWGKGKSGSPAAADQPPSTRSWPPRTSWTRPWTMRSPC